MSDLAGNSVNQFSWVAAHIFVSCVDRVMSADRVHGVVGKSQPVKQRFQFGPWTLTSVKTHILESEGPLRER